MALLPNISSITSDGVNTQFQSMESMRWMALCWSKAHGLPRSSRHVTLTRRNMRQLHHKGSHTRQRQ